VYLGNGIETSVPKRATAEHCAEYAALPDWHIEEAACLVAGFVPRPRNRLNSFPTDHGQSPEPVSGKAAQELASPKRPSWSELLREGGAVAEIVRRYIRFARRKGWHFSADQPYVDKDEFLEFCRACNIAVPKDLIEALRTSHPSRKTLKSSEQDCYEHAIIAAARVLAPAFTGRAPARLTAAQFQGIVDGHFLDADADRVEPSAFRRFLNSLKRNSAAAGQQLGTFLPGRGRPSEDEQVEARRVIQSTFPQFLRSLDAHATPPDE
jgi:hypothetical protein